MQRDVAQTVEEGGFADVGHPYDEETGAEEVRCGGVILMGFREAQDLRDGGFAMSAAEECGCGFEPLCYYVFALSVGFGVIGPEVLLCVDYEAGAGGEGGLEKGVTGRDGEAVVAAFDDEVDGGEEGADLAEPGGVVAEVVGAGNGGEVLEGGARNEG